jgi:hypothetical protein
MKTVAIVIGFYECDFCKKRHWQGKRSFREHMSLRNPAFGVKTWTLYANIKEEKE